MVWTLNLPDRVDAIMELKGELVVLTHDGTEATVSAAGKVTATKTLKPAALATAYKEMQMADPPAADVAKTQMRPDRILKLAASAGVGKVAVGYWGGTLRVVVDGKVKTEQQLPQDVTALASLNGRVVVGLANGQVMLLEVK